MAMRHVYTNQIPANLDVNSPDADVTLGMQWYSEDDGAVYGARFYLGNRNFDGYQVIGVLYQDNNTTALAQKPYTITVSDAIGWVDITFDEPVIVRRNQTYIIGVWFPSTGLAGGNAHYAYTANFFRDSGIDNPPLHAYRNDNIFNQYLNGVYVAGSTPAYPTNSNNASYFIDLSFDYVNLVKVRAGGSWTEYPMKTRAGGQWSL